MKTFYELSPGLVRQSALALGFFDGVHPGHQAVIKKAVEEAARLGVVPAVVTFRDHPRGLTQGRAPQLLTLLEQRLVLFEKLGVEVTLALTFTEELCRLTPREYVETALVAAMGGRSISVGFNHHFGRNREGDANLLRRFGEEMGFVVHVAKEVFVDGLDVSSSRIREALDKGKVDLAARLLGRPYAVLGRVVRGQGRGRGLGFPTANLEVSAIQQLPAVGVYCGQVLLGGSMSLPAVVNVGYRPTFDNDMVMTVEAHVLDFNRDIYDENVSLEFWHFLRSERRFDGVESLRAQIVADCARARQLLADNVAFPSSEQKLLA